MIEAVRHLEDALVEFPLPFAAVVEGLERTAVAGVHLIDELHLNDNFYG